MRVARLLSLFGFAVLLAAGVPGSPAAGDDKPKADPPAKDKDKAERELHIVGTAGGFTKTGDMIHGGKALVTVNRPGKLVTLVLVTGDPVTWEVTLDKDTKVEKVILAGRERAAVKGLPEKTEVKHLYRGASNPQLPEYASHIDSPRFRALLDATNRYVGLPASSFTGSGQAEAAKPLVVDKVQDDDRLSIDWPTPVPAAKLPKMTFQANHYVPSVRAFDMKASYGEFTLAGPVAKSLQPLPDRVTRVTYDPAGKKYYGITDHRIAVVDLEKKTAEKIDMGLDVPQMAWPADITFDTKRNRLMVSTSTGGYLYAYDIKTEKWSVLAEKYFFTTLAYHPKDDTLYALKYDFDGELQHINEKGAVVKTVKLDGPIVPGTIGHIPGVSGVQLIPADDKLILLIAPVGFRSSENAGPRWSCMYLIDPKTGKAQLTWKDK